MADSFIPTKDKTSVTIRQYDGSDLEGYLFVPVHDRLVDVMNDDRQFLPFESMDGDFIVLAKASIVSISAGKASASGVRLRAKPEA